MKRLALIVGALAMTATAAHAQDATEFKNGGEFRIRYENFFNKTGMEDGLPEQHTDARLKWDMNIRKGEKLQAHVTLLHNARFGGVASTGDYSYGTGVNQGVYDSADHNSLLVNRAWGWWRASDAVSFKFGRMGIEFADGAVFAENDWEAVPVTHEGVNVAFDSSFAMFNLYGIKTKEAVASGTGGYAGNSDPEANFYMLTMDLKNMPSAIKMANIHLIDWMNDGATAATGTTNLQHVGLTLGGDTAGFMYKATAAFQFGTANKTPAVDMKQSSNMFDLMVGYAMPETMGLKVSAGYHMDSGDDSTTTDKNEGYQSLFYDRHNYGGLMDVVQWGNLTYFNLNASVMPMEDLEAGLGFYMFSRTSDKSGVNTGRGIAIPAGFVASSDKSIGSELDLFANKSYGPDFKIGARYSMFMPGEYLKNGTPKAEKTAHQAYLQASVAF
jgi:hypothetical protein